MNELNQLRFQPELFFTNLLKICLTYCKCKRSVPLASPTLFCNIQHLISQLKEERNKKEKEEEEKKKSRSDFTSPIRQGSHIRVPSLSLLLPTHNLVRHTRAWVEIQWHESCSFSCLVACAWLPSLFITTPSFSLFIKWKISWVGWMGGWKKREGSCILVLLHYWVLASQQ